MSCRALSRLPSNPSDDLVGVYLRPRRFMQDLTCLTRETMISPTA